MSLAEVHQILPGELQSQNMRRGSERVPEWLVSARHRQRPPGHHRLHLKDGDPSKGNADQR